MSLNDRRRTILLVDDNANVRTLARLFLTDAGYPVVAASDGEAGLRSYDKHKANIVLLLTDVTMPNMNGFELADRLLAMNPQLPVLFMSGDIWSGYRGLDCIAKPFRAPELIEKVSGLLNIPRTLAEPKADFMMIAERTLDLTAPKTRAQAEQVFRLRKSFASVHFEAGGKGRIVFLPKGAELGVIGESRLNGGVEVLHEMKLYNMFRADLFGPGCALVRLPALKMLRGMETAKAACA